MVEIRARSNSEIVDAAFELYRRHFSVFFTLAVLAFLPTVLLQSAAPNPERIGFSFTFLLLLPISFIFSCIGAGAMICATSNAYVLAGPVDIKSAVRSALERPFTLFIAYLLKLLYIGFGFILLIVPGIFAIKNYFAVPATVLIEKLPAGDGMDRSKALARGNGKRILGLFVVLWIFYLIVLGVVSGIVGTILDNAVLREVIMLVTYGLTYPLLEIITTLLYYDLRVRSEGYDIELMAEHLDAATIS